MPPGFDVLDELESQLALDERWEDLLEELLDDADREVAPGLRAAELVQLIEWPKFGGTQALRRVVEDFQANWDLVDQRVRSPRRGGRAGARPVLARVAALVGTPVPPDDKQAEPLAEVRERAARVSRRRGPRHLLGELEASSTASPSRRGKATRRTGATTVAAKRWTRCASGSGGRRRRRQLPR